MNSFALFGELSGSLGSFLPCVPIQQLGVCRPTAGSLGATSAGGGGGGARFGPDDNFCAAGRRALRRQSLSIVPRESDNYFTVFDFNPLFSAVI